MPHVKRRQRHKRRFKKTKQQLNQTKEASTPDAALAAPNVSGVSPDDSSPSEEEVALPQPTQLEQDTVAVWKLLIRSAYREARRKSSESADTGLQLQPTSSNCLGRASTDEVEPQESLRTTKPRPVRARDKRQGRNKRGKRRAVDLDSALPYSYVRNTMLKYERVDDRLKGVRRKYRELVRWKRPLRTTLLLMVALFVIWMGCLLQLVLAPAVFHIIIQSFNMGTDTDSDQTVTLKPTRSRRLRESGIKKVMKLDRRCSKRFKEMSTVFDKTKSLFSCETASVSLCFLLVLLALMLLAFWKGQEFAVQIAVTAILFKVFVLNNIFRRYPHLAARCDLIGHAWDKLPERISEVSEQRYKRG